MKALQAEASGAGLNERLLRALLQVSQIQVATVVRIRLRPLIPKLPIVAGVSISMLQRPEIDFSTALKLSPLLPAIDLCNLPLFDFLINTAIDKVVRALPRRRRAKPEAGRSQAGPCASRQLYVNKRVFVAAVFSGLRVGPSRSIRATTEFSRLR